VTHLLDAGTEILVVQDIQSIRQSKISVDEFASAVASSRKKSFLRRSCAPKKRVSTGIATGWVSQFFHTVVYYTVPTKIFNYLPLRRRQLV